MHIRRVIRKVPDAVEGFQEAAAKLLSDRHHGVLLGGVSLMLEMCEVPARLHPSLGCPHVSAAHTACSA